MERGWAKTTEDDACLLQAIPSVKAGEISKRSNPAQRIAMFPERFQQKNYARSISKEAMHLIM
jgi:hypothetical protein